VARTIYTIGHSNLAADAFFALLDAHGIRRLADVRAFPGSRRHPHFGRPALADACAGHGITYRWMPELGGRRHARSGCASPHRAWQVDAFRAYADYADQPEFAAALTELERFAAPEPTAFLCAEALWWQCHRRLIADRLLLAGYEVRHVAGGRVEPHHLPDFARVVDGRIVYDGGTTAPLL